MTTTASSPTSRAVAPAALAPFVEAGVVSAADVAAAATLVGIAQREQPAVAPDIGAWLAMCLALRAPRDGHTCVPLDAIDELRGDVNPARAASLGWPADGKAWRESLVTAGCLVGTPEARGPFMVENDRLYLARSLHEEREIARLLLAAGDRLEILLGGPGTGKTTQLARRLVDLLRESPTLRIALAAPTGKAAARMAEALQLRLADAAAPAAVREAPQAVREAIAAAHPTTIHTLLGFRPQGTPRYAFHAGNRLDYELVVVDEVSMLASSLMHHLLVALGDKARLVLVGDPDQLASVDAGSVLGDIARAARVPGTPLEDHTRTLTERHRFGPRIGRLADAILRGAEGVDEVFEILDGRWTPPATTKANVDGPRAVRWVEPGTSAYEELVSQVVAHAGGMRGLAEQGNVAGAVQALGQLQVLCAHREGLLGVAGWNALVQRRLGLAGGPIWYAGRPVLVTANSRILGLHNGDVGVVVPAAGGRHEAAFPVGKNFRSLPVTRLENIETVHALTIHKSQGSEYRHVIVVLPEKPSRIVTRELLYTGVTRASDRVTVVGSREVIAAAIRRPIRRATGLAPRLMGGRATRP